MDQLFNKKEVKKTKAKVRPQNNRTDNQNTPKFFDIDPIKIYSTLLEKEG